MALQRFVVVLFILLFVSISVHASPIHVKTDGLDTSDGFTWDTAKKTVTAALTAAIAGDEIWVAKGTYVERLTMKNGVDLYGGFSGSETERSQRNWTTNTTILDGNQAGSVVTAFFLTSGRIDGFTVRNGKSTGSGGGIFCVASTMTAANCTITANTAVTGGGFSGNGSYTLINCFIYRNNATQRGGGVYCGTHPLSGSVINNTISANTALIEGGGICINNSPVSIVNNIICFNSSGVAKQTTSGTPELKNNCVYNPEGFNYSNISAGTGDISLDPLFESLDFARFHIQPESPCIDTGDDSVFVPDSVDIDGQPRKVGDHIDMGADESDDTEWNFEPRVVRVHPDGDDLNDGSSWSSAKKTVNSAITSASEYGGEVWVAAGTYYERITIPTGVYVYGGFAGTENARDERDYKSNVTTLNGGGTGTVVTSQAIGYPTATINGFTITGGNSNTSGGGIECVSLRISNNAITGNKSTSRGGGINCTGPSVIAGNIITDNDGGPYGGGIYATDGCVISGNTITNNRANQGAGAHCAKSSLIGNTISANIAGDKGGGIYTYNGQDITGNTIEGNTARDGAGIHYYGNSQSLPSGIITRNIIIKNKASNKAAIYLDHASLHISDNTIKENEGGGIYSYGSSSTSTVSITNNQIEANTIKQGAAGIQFEYGSSLTVTGNTISKNCVTGTAFNGYNYNSGGLTCVDVKSVVISENSLIDNTTFLGAGGIYCSSLSTTITNNRITGNKLKTHGEYNDIYLAIHCAYGNPTISGNFIADNVLLDTPFAGAAVRCVAVLGASNANISENRIFPDAGDGIYCEGGSGLIRKNTVTGGRRSGIYCYSGSCVVACNAVSANQDGIRTDTSSTAIINNTVTANNENGVYAYYTSSPIVSNNIIAFNSTGIRSTGGGLPILKNNCLYNPEGIDYLGISKGLSDITTDPRLESVEYGKVHLQPDSPCIDAGDSLEVKSEWLDIDGAERITDSAVDIGADEADGETHNYEPMIMHVAVTGDDANDGTSWQKAKRSIQNAIHSLAVSGGQVWVKRGIYEEQINLKPYVYLYGGFNGKEEALSNRNWKTSISTINAKKKGAAVTATAVGRRVSGVDGFTVTEGSTCGFYVEFSSPIISNNRIIDNTGGGIRCHYSFSSILNNYISGNNASGYGGGIYTTSPSRSSDLQIINNTISGNSSAQGGGGVYGEERIVLVNNTIAENQAPTGGGIFLRSTYASLDNNIVAFNSSGIYAWSFLSNHNNCVYNPGGDNYTEMLPGKYDISADPLFVNRTAQDYHLQKTSPCINTGWNDAPGLPSVDMDGQARVMFGTVDMGADEYATARNIYEAKLVDNGYRAEIDGAIVTAVFPGYFYIEGSDRSNGIRVEQIGHDLAVGSRASVTGTANESSNGERCITALTITTTGTGSIEALALNNRRIGGGMFGKQNGVWSWRYVRQPDKTLKLEWLPSVGLNNIGLLLRTCGKITYVGYGFFYLDDGSHNNDGSGHIGIKVYGTLPVTDGNVIGRFVYINGISSCEKSGEDLISVILTRNQQDVVLGD